MGVVRTVLGDIDPNTIGSIAFHEHVLFDIVPPGRPGDREADIELENRWQIDYLSNDSPANAFQTDHEVAAAELRAFADDGGSLIVDQSVAGLARDPKGLAQASSNSSTHVVAAAGCYTVDYMPEPLMAMDVDELTELFVAEVHDGFQGTNVRAGIIGEIGCSWPMHPAEHKALKAAARAASITGAALSVHPGRSPSACQEILDVTESEGLDPARTVLCHMDRTHPTGDGIDTLLARGANVEWDFFGIEQSYYWMGDEELPTDRDRVRLIRSFADKGHAQQILVSQDICTKTRLQRWGGHGYGHMLRNIVPLMKKLGYEIQLISQLLRETPLRLLTLKET